jgi:hypothetical protein
MKLTAAQIKKLPREVWYNSYQDVTWIGRSDGKIIHGLYLVVYPAYSKVELSYKQREPVFVPLTSVFTF